MQAPQRTLPGHLATGRMNRRESAVVAHHARQMAKVTWDFANDGGAVGDIEFGLVLPENSLILQVVTDEQTAVTGADDITLAAGSQALVSNIDFTADSGVHVRFQAHPLLTDSATNTIAEVQPIKLTAARELKITIATNAATAGKVVFLVEYINPDLIL